MAAFSEISFDKLYAQVQTFLQTTYNKVNQVFRNSSPFGQLLAAFVNLFQTNILYVKTATAQWDINNPLNNNTKAIRAISVIAGHDPSRAISASGTLQLMLNNDVDISSEIQGAVVTVYNQSQIRNQVNNLIYSVNLGAAKISYSVQPNTPIFIPVIEGQWSVQSFTGDGTDGQSFNVNIAGNDEIDQYQYTVTVNSQLWAQKTGLYNMLPGEQAYYARTGIAGGIDIFFGTQDFGTPPPAASVIVVNYLISDGVSGNVLNPNTNDFVFIDEIYDGQGNSVDVTSNFTVTVYSPVNFGADGESTAFTKALLPLSGGNGINGTLNTTDQIAFFLLRLGIYSIVDVYLTDTPPSSVTATLTALLQQNTTLLKNAVAFRGIDYSLRSSVTQNLEQIQLLQQQLAVTNAQVMNVFLVPNVEQFYGRISGLDYFDIPISSFILDADEQARILTYLQTSGNLSINTSINIVDPQEVYYVLNVTIRLFDTANAQNVQNTLRSEVSTFMLNLTRRDRVPPSDFVAIVEAIPGVDSADCAFVSKATEAYFAEYNAKAAAFFQTNQRNPNQGEIIMDDGTVYDPNTLIGIDPILGDAVFDQDELFLLRGGWSDRYNTYYGDGVTVTGPSSLNTIILPQRTITKASV